MPYRILLVDSDRPHARTISRQLTERGDRVTTRHSCSEALELLRSDACIDIALLDPDPAHAGVDRSAARQLLGVRELPLLLFTPGDDDRQLPGANNSAYHGLLPKYPAAHLLKGAIELAYAQYTRSSRLNRAEEEKRRLERELHAKQVQLERERSFRIIADYTYDWEDWIGTRGELLWVNSAVERITGYSPRECYAMPDYPYPLIHPEEREISRDDIERGIKEEESYALREFRCLCKDGSLKWISVCWQPVYDAQGRNRGIRSSMRDITRLKQSEEALRRSERRTRTILQAIPDLMFVIRRDGTYVDYHAPAGNDALYADPSQFLGRKMEEVLPEEAGRPLATALETALASDELQLVEYTLELSGKKRFYEARISPYEQESVLCIVRDISARRWAEERIRESERRYRLLFEHANEGIVIYQEGRTKLFNPKTLEITGYSEEEYRSLTIDHLAHPDDRELLKSKYRKRIAGEITDEPYELRIVSKTGQVKWLRMKPARILWDDEPATLGMIEDITTLKETEAHLQQTLEQKDHLMRELNHRVKNNLYMIASLVNLKDASLGDAVDLSDIKHQIEAIGIVHDKLSYVENVSSINLRDYLLDIFERLFSNYSAQEVRIEEEIESITVPTKQAIPLGLISNEIATNAIKYGFLPTEEAVFTVSLITDPDTEECIYTLANSGRPFPDEVELEHADSLGLRLIQVLVSQLGGSIHLQKRPRTRFTLRLPLLRQD